jgi:uncharacterized protein (TIGR03663 family)
LMLAAASASLMFATKETCIISFTVLLLAWLCTRFYLHLRGKAEPMRFAEAAPEIKTGLKRFQWPALAALVCIVIWLLFYSSFFTNYQGLADSLRTFEIWTHTGVQTDQYRAPVSRYFDWLSAEELPVLLLGCLVGIPIALWKARDRFAVFTAFWTLGITAAYSLVPYKTPWLAVNLILPLGLIGGYGLGQWHSFGELDSDGDAKPWFRISSALVLVGAVGFSAYQAIDISFYHYDDDSGPYKYVYAHTSRQLVDLVDEVEAIAARNPAGNNTGMAIVSPDYWPLVWYLRDYPRALFWGRIVETSEPIVIASSKQTDEVEKSLGRLYRAYKSYDLRPGNVLVLYLRRDIRP